MNQIQDVLVETDLLPTTQGELPKLFAAIGLAQAAFPALPRTATGQVGKDRKFQYAPYHKVVQCIKMPLAKNGVSFVQALQSDGEIASITLLVAGHGAILSSTLKFKQDSDIKVFGAAVTYNKRYQLTAFFGLEGDPDADDFEDDISEVRVIPAKEQVAKPAVQAKVESAPVAAKETAKEVNQAENKSVQKDTRSIGEKLTDAMKQLNWKMPDFDKFITDNQAEFPGVVSAAKLSADMKIKLYDLLVSRKMVAPFNQA